MKRLYWLSDADLYPSQRTSSASSGVGGSDSRIANRLRLPQLTPFLSLPFLGGCLNPIRPADSSRKGRSAVRQSPSALCPARDTTIRTARQVVVGRLASGQHIQISSDVAANDERRD